MKIISLTVENIKRVSAVSVEPGDAALVVIAGGNAEGKSSTIDAIEMALGGERRIPVEPLRRGAAKGRIVVDVDDYRVERKFTKSGTSLVVTAKGEATARPSPQALLDRLYGQLSFDPLAFARAKDEDQNRILRALANLDTSAIDARRDRAFEERTLVNREAKSLEAQVAAAPRHTGVPAEPIETQAVMDDLAKADHLAGEAAHFQALFGKAEEQLAAAERTSTAATRRVDELRAELEAAEEAELAAQSAVGTAKHYLAEMRERAAAAGKKVPDRMVLRGRIAEATTVNALVGENQRHAQLAAALHAKYRAADDLTNTINNCAAEKAALLAAATFPIAGLAVTDSGVTWQGLPFSQASTAVRTRVSVAIGAALNPTLRVILVRSGNDLDDKSLALLATLAEEYGLQVWVERIAGAGDLLGAATVVIEDGQVQS